MIEFRGPAKRIEDLDLVRVAREIGVGEDEIHAVLDVESAGSGFDAKGRPKMLFEPHVFYRNLSGERRDRAVREGIAYAQWRTGSYPSDSYPRLIAAIAVDETAALKAASWGLGQILGENHKAAGYATPQDMVKDYTLDEDNHLESMIRFIKAKGLADELKRHDWAGFAKGYNGALYASHGYHTKLEAAFNRWRRIKDTPYLPPDVEVSRTVTPTTKPDNMAGGIGGAAVVISGVIIADQTKKKGASNGDIAIVVACTIAIAVAVFFVVRHWRRSK